MTSIRDAVATVTSYLPQYFSYQQTYMPYVGAQVAIWHDGELLYNDAFGHADVSGNVPLTVDHLFRIASHSKTFTGVACLQLAEQGKLRLDDLASDHVEELKGHAIGEASVRDLLGHLSGMTRDGEDSTWWSLNKPFPNEKELLDEVILNGRILAPNEHFKYSNIGYSLLGVIIERASGVPYREYVTTNIVEKLGLEKTGPDLDFDRLDDYAKGYSSRAHGPDRIEIEHIDTFAESSATGFYSTAQELSAYFQAHLDGDDRILTDASKRKMRQVQATVTEDSSYGLGLIISKVNGRTYHGHSGGYPGHITMSKLDLERRLSVSVLTNSNDGPAGTLAVAILHLIDLALAEKSLTDVQDAADLKKFEGRFASLWGYTDVVNLGGRLYSLMPTSPNPGGDATEMKVVSETELEPVGDKGFGGYAERMRYHFTESGDVDWIRGASGFTMVPVEKFTLPKKLNRPKSK